MQSNFLLPFKIPEFFVAYLFYVVIYELFVFGFILPSYLWIIIFNDLIF